MERKEKPESVSPAPVVAVDDAIGVEHGHDLEDEHGPQEGRLSTVARQEVQDACRHGGKPYIP